MTRRKIVRFELSATAHGIVRAEAEMRGMKMVAVTQRLFENFAKLPAASRDVMLKSHDTSLDPAYAEVLEAQAKELRGGPPHINETGSRARGESDPRRNDNPPQTRPVPGLASTDRAKR
jgi:hypothetical protein